MEERRDYIVCGGERQDVKKVGPLLVLDLTHTDLSKKWKNQVRNLKEGRNVVIQGVFEHT